MTCQIPALCIYRVYLVFLLLFIYSYLFYTAKREFLRLFSCYCTDIIHRPCLLYVRHDRVVMDDEDNSFCAKHSRPKGGKKKPKT